jgi:hypothetical protein
VNGQLLKIVGVELFLQNGLPARVNLNGHGLQAKKN